MMGFAKSLIKGYAHQLIGFNYPQITLEDVSSFSDNLRHVGVSVATFSDEGYMPQICAENLISLDLTNLSSDFGWSFLKNGGSSKCLDFGNLKWLQLRAGTDHNTVDGIGTIQQHFIREFNRIIAPKLETVIIQLRPFTFSFLSLIHGSTAIRNVELEMDGATIFCTGFNPDRARELFSSYANNSQDDYRFINKYAYMKDILKIHNLAEYTKTSVGLDNTSFDFEQVDWKYLQDIEIHCPVHINDMNTLAFGIPNLENIHIHILRVKVNGELISEIEDKESIVELLGLNLKHFSVANIAGHTKNEVDKLNVYLENSLARV